MPGDSAGIAVYRRETMEYKICPKGCYVVQSWPRGLKAPRCANAEYGRPGRVLDNPSKDNDVRRVIRPAWCKREDPC